jgi:hypothetical protein
MGRSAAASRGRGNRLQRKDLQGFFDVPGDRRIAAGSSRGGPAAEPRHQPSPKKAHSPARLAVPEFARGDSMPNMQTDLIRPVPSIVPHDIPAMSDEECLVALAQAVRQQDSERLDEVARLIARLAVTIE